MQLDSFERPTPELSYGFDFTSKRSLIADIVLIRLSTDTLFMAFGDDNIKN